VPDSGGDDESLTFWYDNGPAEGMSAAFRQAEDRTRTLRWPRWSLRLHPREWSWPRWHPFRWLGDFFAFLAAADPEAVVPARERHRSATLGLLMAVATAQAFYAATLFMSVSLGRPFLDQAGFGAVFALSVYLIDRSIVSYPSAIKTDRQGNLRPPKKASWVVGIRVIIAIAAALLMSEMILLQVFAADINEQIQTDHIATTAATDKQIQANYQGRIAPLQGQIDNTANLLSARNADVNNAYAAMNCQEFGCPAQHITAGFGPGYDAAKIEWENAVTAQDTARTDQKSIQAKDQPQINSLETAEQKAINGAQPAINHADKVLSQEEAFGQLTLANGTVLAVRVLLSLLILGIDLAPILTKLSGRTSLNDILAHSNDFLAMEDNRRRVATRLYHFAQQGDADRARQQLEAETAVFQAQQTADVLRHQAQQEAGVERARADAKADTDRHEIDFQAQLTTLRQESDFDQQSRLISYRYPGPGRSPSANVGFGAPSGPVVNGGFGVQGDPGANGGGPGPYGGQAWEQPQGNGDSGAPGDGDLQTIVFRHEPPVAVDEGEPGPAVQQDLAYYSAPPVGAYGVPATRNAPAVSELPSPSFPEPDQPPLTQLDRTWSAPDGLTAERDEIAEIYFPPEQEPAPLDGRWVLKGRLPGVDKSGGGTVSRARDLQGDPNAWFVVKTVPSGLATRRAPGVSSQIAGVRHEQRMARQRLNHPHIGQVIDSGEDNGYFYLVYPLYEPGSLTTYCSWRRGQLDLPWAAQVILDVLDGLVAAAARDLVHLDIKPGNIVLDGSRARVIDWGFSRMPHAGNVSTLVQRGTPFFACPEQFTGPRDGWDTPLADLYGVGATFYWLLTGEAPLQRQIRSEADLDFAGYRELLKKKARPEPVRRLVNDVPRPVSNLIDRWLSLDPARRVPRRTPMDGALQAARAELLALMPSLPPVAVGQVTARRRKR
jgi:hypothetical protein